MSEQSGSPKGSFRNRKDAFESRKENVPLVNNVTVSMGSALSDSLSAGSKEAWDKRGIANPKDVSRPAVFV